METFSTRLPAQLIKRVKAYAKIKGMKMYCVVLEALTQFLNNNDPAETK